jgi:hypothetical protein
MVRLDPLPWRRWLCQGVEEHAAFGEGIDIGRQGSMVGSDSLPQRGGLSSRQPPPFVVVGALSGSRAAHAFGSDKAGMRYAKDKTTARAKDAGHGPEGSIKIVNIRKSETAGHRVERGIRRLPGPDIRMDVRNPEALLLLDGPCPLDEN